MRELMIAEKHYPIINLPGRPPAMLDKHVAEIYEVSTREINQAVKNNPGKFPEEFLYQLTKEEVTEVVKNFDNLSSLKFSPHLPWCYAWEGCNMLATILKSDIATKRAIQIVRGFTRVEQKIVESTKYSTHPLVQQAQHILEYTQKWLEVQDEQQRQATKIKQIEAKQDAIIKQSGYYSILGYANVKGIQLTLRLAAKLGRMAVSLSKKLGLKIDKVPDPRYGRVGIYHESILERLFKDLN